MLGVSAARAAAIAAEYPLAAYPSPAVAFSALVADANFACPALQVDRWTSERVPTFAYEFNDDAAPQRFAPPGVRPRWRRTGPSSQYLFDLPNAPFPAPLNADQEQLAATMRAAWAQLRGERRPGIARRRPWPSFGGADSTGAVARHATAIASTATSPRDTTARSGARASERWSGTATAIGVRRCPAQWRSSRAAPLESAARSTRGLARWGWAIVVVYLEHQRRAEATVAEILAAEGTTVAVRADLADDLDVQRLFAESIAAFGGVDAVVHTTTDSASLLYQHAARARPRGRRDRQRLRR